MIYCGLYSGYKVLKKYCDIYEYFDIYSEMNIFQNFGRFIVADKKLVIISMVDGTPYEAEELHNMIEPIVKDTYRIVTSAQPIQAVDPLDLMGQLRHIYLTEETDEQYDYISRDMRMLKSLQAVQDAVKGLHKEMDAIRDNIQGVANELPGVDHFNTMRVTTGMQEVESALERIGKNLPAEGEKW